jgi:hypothetical protein
VAATGSSEGNQKSRVGRVGVKSLLVTHQVSTFTNVKSKDATLMLDPLPHEAKYLSQDLTLGSALSFQKRSRSDTRRPPNDSGRDFRDPIFAPRRHATAFHRAEIHSRIDFAGVCGPSLQ